jgi:hypothetical protein
MGSASAMVHDPFLLEVRKLAAVSDLPGILSVWLVSMEHLHVESTVPPTSSHPCYGCSRAGLRRRRTPSGRWSFEGLLLSRQGIRARGCGHALPQHRQRVPLHETTRARLRSGNCCCCDVLRDCHGSRVAYAPHEAGVGVPQSTVGTYLPLFVAAATSAI